MRSLFMVDRVVNLKWEQEFKIKMRIEMGIKPRNKMGKYQTTAKGYSSFSHNIA